MQRFATNAALAVAVVLGAGGCAYTHNLHSGGAAKYPDRNEVPVATNFETSPQLKLQAAEHWRRVANDAADGLAKSLPPRSALHVARACDTTGCAPRPCETTFNRVFHSEFLTALVERGYQVSSVPSPNATLVEIDSQAVGFTANRPQYRYAGEPVELGQGVWALRDTVTLVDGAGVATVHTGGMDSNWFRTEFAGGATPRNELVLTVSALSQTRTYLARNTRVYYTSDADAAHYFCPAATVERPQRMRVSTIPVTGDCTGPRCLEADGRQR